MSHTHDERKDCMDEPITAHPGAHVNVVKIALGKETLAVVILLAVVIGACGLIMGLNLSEQAAMDRSFNERAAVLRDEMKAVKTQEWLKERRLMDAEALMIREGFMQPTDLEYGPAGNIHYRKEKGDGRK